jgi:exodeoxyribonuclease VII large subunit
MRQPFQPKVGEKVFVHGNASVYERNSRLQIKSDVIHPAGVGLLQLQLELLRQRLEAEGLFDPARKRPLPLFPKRIGVVTSPTGAVWHDIRRVLARRYPMAELILAPAVVQGDSAPVSVVAALAQIQDAGVDVIVLARGGGSAEDLWAFNDERIARAIFACPVPVVSAIGHETDTTIADMVADVRASTPSVAAELIAPDITDLALVIDDFMSRSRASALAGIDRHQRSLLNLQHRLGLASPKSQLVAMQASVNAERARLRSAAALAIERKAHGADRAGALIGAFDPVALTRRGYALLTDSDSRQPIRGSTGLQPRDRIMASFVDGQINATIDDVIPAPLAKY